MYRDTSVTSIPALKPGPFHPPSPRLLSVPVPTSFKHCYKRFNGNYIHQATEFGGENWASKSKSSFSFSTEAVMTTESLPEVYADLPIVPDGPCFVHVLLKPALVIMILSGCTIMVFVCPSVVNGQ
jgi:hypothetical protein